ncbi:hypothetical protein ACFVZW_25755 [Streptomyces sp. NPDC059567]|uniref:hypothetical protein n=1 Tax=Streptomyces sp. NPDC059567 TaxID=3346867 RepID=UPI0036C3E278
MHQAGLVHRDVKPGNARMADDGPRLIDFGIAKAIAPATAATTLTGAHVIGTPGFHVYRADHRQYGRPVLRHLLSGRAAALRRDRCHVLRSRHGRDLAVPGCAGSEKPSGRGITARSSSVTINRMLGRRAMATCPPTWFAYAAPVARRRTGHVHPSGAMSPDLGRERT